MIATVKGLLDFLHDNAEFEDLREAFVLKRYLHPIKQFVMKHPELLFFDYSAEYAVVAGKEKHLIDLFYQIDRPNHCHETAKLADMVGRRIYFK